MTLISKASRIAAASVLFTATIAASFSPALAQGQSRELKQDRHEIHQEKQQLNHARRSGNRQEVKQERGDVAHAKREYRQDLSDYREYRRQNRQAFRAGAFNPGHSYRSYRTGTHINARYYGNFARLANYRAYRLPTPARNTAWVRNYDDVMLVNLQTGIVLRVIPNFFW